MRNLLALALIINLALMSFLLAPQPVSAQQDSLGFVLSMPVEYVNYTIVSVNGALWAKIDGIYPMHISGDVPDALPMVYPTPPQTTNIRITLDGKELSWSNYTETFPTALHHTAIGDWAMVSAVISPVSETFTLGIHYEHPLQVVNGSFLFLYDINISPYLSPVSKNSTAYFTVSMEPNTTNIKTFTTETDTKWNPINSTITKDVQMDVVSIVTFSEYGKPLLGDLVVEFSNPYVPEFPFVSVVALIAASGCVLVFFKRRLQRTIPDKD